LNKDELKALVLYDYGYTLWKADRLHEALAKYEEARRYEQSLPRNLRDSLFLDAGLAEAEDSKKPEEKKAAILLVDQVGKSIRSKGIEGDPYFLGMNVDRYHITRSASLIAVGQNKAAIEELQLVKAGPERPRRQVYKDTYQAQALINLGEYSEAADFAASGLIIAQEIDSEQNIARVDRLHKQFPRGLFKHDEHVARLGYLLSKRKKRSKR